MADFRVHSLTVGPFQENCYIVLDDASGSCVVIDPGDEWLRIVDFIRTSGCELKAIWLTHAHLDHIGAVAGILRTWQVPVYLHDSDLPLYQGADRQAAWYGLAFETPPLPDRSLKDGDVMQLGTHEFTVMHTPGHAPGHVIFIGQEHVFGGDLVFMDSIGRTDLPLSNPADMTQSLARIMILAPELELHPGHGPSTTLKREFEMNPFLNGSARVSHG